MCVRGCHAQYHLHRRACRGGARCVGVLWSAVIPCTMPQRIVRASPVRIGSSEPGAQTQKRIPEALSGGKHENLAWMDEVWVPDLLLVRQIDFGVPQSLPIDALADTPEVIAV